MRVRVDHYVELDVDPVGGADNDGETLHLRATKAGWAGAVGHRAVEVEFEPRPSGWSTPRAATLGATSDGVLEITVATNPLIR